MAQEKGVRVTCNRCGTSVFLKYEGTRPREWQSPEEVYEKAPPGWFTYRILDEKRDLCPACSEKWEEMAGAFLRQERIIIDTPREEAQL